MTIAAGELTFGALGWGPEDGPLALLLHGFPDTAWGWRHVGPALGDAGWRVVAPFLRGYAPSGVAPDGDHSAPAYAADAIALHAALGGDERALLVGHDWGAVATYLVAGRAQPAFGAAVTLSIPPLATLGSPSRLVRALRTAARQLGLSSYMAYFALFPGIAERSLPRLIPWLWRHWSPGYDGAADVARVLAAVGSSERRRAAIAPYRALLLPWTSRRRVPVRDSLRLPRIPLLYLHGREDRCFHADTARLGGELLPDGAFTLVDRAGHFLALEQPEAVSARILAFARSATRAV